MLTLPPEWSSCSTRYVVEHLFRQADTVHQYFQAAHAMTRASLEYMLAGPRWTAHKEQKSLIPQPRGWRLNKWVFYVLPRVDDAALAELADSPRHRCGIDVLAPPWAEQVVRNAVQGILPRCRVDVYSIDRYVDLRILFTSIDMNQRHADALMDLLQRYARLPQTTPDITIQGLTSA